MPKDIDEIIRIHDILDEALNNKELLIDWNDVRSRQDIICVKRTLCWILDHDEGRWLQFNIDKLETALTALGFQLKRIQ